MQIVELVAWPLAERLQAMKSLWDSLSDQTQTPVLPAWHEEELSKRVAALDSGEEVATPWETAKERIRQRAEQLVRPS
jgi:putative addiction module component (TIGR02574 family)